MRKIIVTITVIALLLSVISTGVLVFVTTPSTSSTVSAE